MWEYPFSWAVLILSTVKPFLHQPLIYIHHALNLVLKKPGGAVVLRGGLEGLKERRVVFVGFFDIAVDSLAA